LRLATTGLLLGLSISLVLTRLVRGLLFGISAVDPLTLAAVTVVLLLIAVGACWLPALKAMRIDPVTAIRQY
jgi:putative ABC transport system permease protein